MATDSTRSSEVYNPAREPIVDELFALMTAAQPDEALLAEYKLMFQSMSAVNPYTGLFTNPRACEVDQAKNDVGEIIEDIKDNPELPDDLTPPLEDAIDYLDQYKEHTDRLIANFPVISSIVQSEIGNKVAELQGANPCLQFGDIMGSILKAGQDIINQILAMLADLKNAVKEELEEMIKEAINKLMAAIAAAMAQLQEEVQKIAEAMLNMNKMNLAQVMKYQMQDPCLKHIMSGVLTGAAQSALAGAN